MPTNVVEKNYLNGSLFVRIHSPVRIFVDYVSVRFCLVYFRCAAAATAAVMVVIIITISSFLENEIRIFINSYTPYLIMIRVRIDFDMIENKIIRSVIFVWLLHALLYVMRLYDRFYQINSTILDPIIWFRQQC